MALSNSKSRALTARHHEKGLVAKEAPEGLERSAATCPSVSSPLCLYGKILGLNKVVRLEFVVPWPTSVCSEVLLLRERPRIFNLVNKRID